MISIVIPTYNRGNLIKRSVKSILNQTYKDIEVIVVDDNSSDDTQRIVESINDSRVKYYKLNENRGACFARNKGVDLSNGEYIAFQDSDDEWDYQKLEQQLGFLQEKNYDIVSCKINCKFSDREVIFPQSSSISLKRIYYKNSISTQTILGKKECFLEERFNVDLPRFQDWELAIRLINKYKIGIVDKVLVTVFMQDDSISKNPKKAIMALQSFMELHGKDKKVIGYYNRLIGLYKMQNNEQSKFEFRKAFKLNPFNKEIMFDFILSMFNMNKAHYNFYVKRGRFR